MSSMKRSSIHVDDSEGSKAQKKVRFDPDTVIPETPQGTPSPSPSTLRNEEEDEKEDGAIELSASVLRELRELSR